MARAGVQAEGSFSCRNRWRAVVQEYRDGPALQGVPAPDETAGIVASLLQFPCSEADGDSRQQRVESSRSVVQIPILQQYPSLFVYPLAHIGFYLEVLAADI